MRFFNSYYLLLQIIVFLCGAQVATSCLKCFTTPADRASICYHAVSLDKMGAEECLQRLHWGFDPLNNISIAFNQINNIKKYLKTFEKEVKKIEKRFWVEQFDKKMTEFVKGVKDRVASHPPVECRSPCGLQKAARTFSCSRCAEEDCKIPVTCPLTQTKSKAVEEKEAEFQRALAEKLPAQEEEEVLMNHACYAIYGAVGCLIVAVLVGILWYECLSYDWVKKIIRSRTSFPPERYLP